MGFLVSQHGQLGAIPPPPFLNVSHLGYMRSRGARPPPPLKRGISAILARYPMKTRQMGARPPSAMLSRKGIARYGGVSRTGPLSSPQKFHANFAKNLGRQILGKTLSGPNPKGVTSWKLQREHFFVRPGSRQRALFRVAPVRFGSVTVWGWKGSIGSGFRFRRFLYKKGFSVFQ